ncbi:NADPH:quinone oxidoreductase family protein [Actinomadura spongiicola]|uniref:NADPH:quinone oxidoreductase family protein n=1 Tax=Actinomadura spongiicola TaxID=2303421 RepID=A0A372GP74_9ACTN|nr:zinc-binding dehydrogenase [Actinomadura spongiicola]RFS87186.1 NADPH:quinone oxidoreductase family protein [Actinomadura spongiicola]
MEIAETMRALVQKSPGGPPTLVDDVPRPIPGRGELLIRVAAAGVNFADVMQAQGTYGGGPETPYVAGFEAVGEVIDAGPGTATPLGTRVVGTGPGAFAQYMTMPDAGVLQVPEGWPDAAALGMVLNWATALTALRPLGDVRPGSVVLVHAAAGGVGQAAVRLALHHGARVIATASPPKHDTVRALGVKEVLDGSRPDLADAIMRLTGGVDLVLESVGLTTFAASLSVAKPYTGRVVVFGAASGDASLTTHDLVFRYPVQVRGLHIGTFASTVPHLYEEVVAELHALITKGVYPPGNPHVHALADGPQLLQDLEAGRTIGKHALDPWA